MKKVLKKAFQLTDKHDSYKTALDRKQAELELCLIEMEMLRKKMAGVIQDRNEIMYNFMNEHECTLGMFEQPVYLPQPSKILVYQAVPTIENGYRTEE